MEVPLKKTKIELPYDVAIPLLGIYSVRKISLRRKWQPTPVFLPRKSLGQRNLVGFATHGVAKSQTWLSDFIFLSFPFQGKPDRDRQMPYDVTYMWNLKEWHKWIYFQNRNRVTDTENKLMVTRGEDGLSDKLGDWDWHTLTTIYEIYN